ncbi:MAG TPA: LLM class F420-dependent oxidoreductase [Acidimicrobiales bacterium]|nr:LLM class F420-dependent oxidoreductase [Acidimicrobiales bacterium]
MLIGANLILNDTTLPMREVAPMIEEHGLDSLFLGEHTHTPVDTVQPDYPDGLPEFYKRFMDPFVQLAVAATVTERVRIGTGVVLVAERNPLELAKAVASLDIVSGGRVEVGVGYGWNPLELANNGVDPAKRRAVFREKLAVVRRLWTEDVVGMDGEFVRFTDSWSYPKPLQKPHPPILIGAAGTKATFDDVVNLGDGWYPLASDNPLDKIATLTERAGGTLPPVTVIEMEGQRGTPWYVDEPAVLTALGERARQYADAGVHRMTVGVPSDDAGRLRAALEQLDALAHVVA